MKNLTISFPKASFVSSFRYEKSIKTLVFDLFVDRGKKKFIVKIDTVNIFI